MSRTDKTRPFRVKMLDKPGNYREVHNHHSRVLLDEQGNAVRVPVEGKFVNGHQVMATVYVPHPTCDLPASPWDKDDRPYSYYSCHYTYTYSWINTGEARCGCPMCSDTVGRKQETRSKRRAAKRAVRNWEVEY